MRTVENPADPVCQLVGREQPLGLYHLALAVDPLGLHRVEPRALDGQEADDDPYSLATVLDSSVVRGNPPSYLFGDVPGGVVPDQHLNLLARRPKLLAAPRQKAGAYPAHGAAIRETYPHILQLGHIKPVAGDGLRIGIVFLDRSFDEAQGSPASLQLLRAGLARRLNKLSSKKSKKPATPSGRASARRINRWRRRWRRLFLAYSGSGEAIHLLARSQRTPIRASLVRTVSPVMRSSVKPSSKLTSAARSSVHHRLVSLPNLLGVWCKSSRKASARSGSRRPCERCADVWSLAEAPAGDPPR